MQKNPEGESCGTCAFSLDLPGGTMVQVPGKPGASVKLLKCRRFPPYAFPLAVQGGKLATPDNPQGAQMGSVAIWPDVAPGQWCGEWSEFVTEEQLRNSAGTSLEPPI